MISIIIPCKKFNNYLKECLENIKQLDFNNYEVIVLPDEESEIEGVKVIATKAVKPGKKRNIGAREARGEILAFIDDDAYPRSDWLNNAIKYFQDESVTAVCGPGVTPESDSFWAQVSGAVYLSWLSGGNPNRFFPGKKKEVDDWPSVNFLVQGDEFLRVGGFDKKYWPGEDTKLCLSLKKIIYAPDVVVYHHRRPGFIKHLKQVGAYGWHRGHFMRKYPANSFKFKYFLPSCFFLFVVFGWLLLFVPFPFSLIYPALWAVYLLAILIAMVQIYIRLSVQGGLRSKAQKIGISLASIIYIIPTHVWYGLRFIHGIVKK